VNAYATATTPATTAAKPISAVGNSGTVVDVLLLLLLVVTMTTVLLLLELLLLVEVTVTVAFMALPDK